MSQPNEEALEELRQQVEEDENPRNDTEDNTAFKTDNDGGDAGHDGKAGN